MGNILVTLAGLLSAFSAQAQTKRCDLVGRDTTITGNPTAFKRCLDLNSIDGDTIKVPSNVTRIDNDGLSLCKGSVQSGGDVDLAYIYDNSGSMKSNLAYVNTATNDTSFYENDVNCTDKTRHANTATFQSWNAGGTSTAARTIPRLNSNTGCTALAGDPYNTRGRAFYLGIADQAARAPLSTAGIMSFNGSVGNIRQPRVMNSSANLDFIRNGINAVSDGGTNYGPPLDTAKKWLTGPLTSNSKKAIIFLSDGKPSDTNYTPTLTTMPKIYGIFLGKPRPDTLALYNMSQRTGGKFYLIPPDDPDSLKSVVAAILNIILLEYTPQGATVSNTSLSPVQSATSAPGDFVLQPDGSWLMKLSDVIGLKGSSVNAITVATTFKEKVSGSIDSKSVTFIVRTTEPASSTSLKIGTTQFAINCYDKSSLYIQNALGIRPPWFTDTNTQYQVRIRTAPAPLDSLVAAAVTGAKGDAESPVLKAKTASTDSVVFRNPFGFLVSSGSAHTKGNGTLESNLYDSIIVAWTHPRDAQDFAADTMRVRALPVAAAAWFSQTNGGPATNEYEVDAARAFIVITDQAVDPRRTYTAVVTAEKFGIDREVVTLTETSPGSGKLVGSIPFQQLTAKNPGDNGLQVSNGGDQLRVVYRDPVDGDSATATAGYEENVEEAASLEFTDAAGVPLSAGSIWSPSNGKLYFTYGDDYAKGGIAAKQVSLTLVNRKYGTAIGTDKERVVLSLASGAVGTRATWTGSIDLADAFPPDDSNGTAESRFRGEASVTVNSHDRMGNQEAATVSDFLVIAYPDSQAVLSWKMDTTVAADEGMIFTVNDQTFTLDRKDTALVTVACTKSGDSVSGLAALEGPTATSGSYVTGTLAKNEGVPTLSDRALSCFVTDQIRVRYVDPVYGTLTELLIDEVARPEANPPGRRFVFNEIVTLSSATPGSVIYYTTDGSAPVPGTSPVYSAPIRISVTTTLRAIAVKAGFKDSKVLTQVYTKESIASRLEILDENGNTIPGGVITGASGAVRIRLVTTQDNLGSVETALRTLKAGDIDTVELGNSVPQVNALELWQPVTLIHPKAKSPGNDTIEATGTDTLIATWVNPFNPADIARDTVIIKPAFVAAQVYFSATENGAKTTEFAVNTDTVFIVVKTRPRDPELSYTVTVTSSELGIDKLVLNLTQLSPGVFTAKAPVGTSAKLQSDAVLQVALAGDQLTAVFKDPVYLDDYSGNAGFAQGVQETPQLEFTDESGFVIAPSVFWNPDKGKIYVRYTDDWNAGISALVHTKTVRFDLANMKSGAAIGSDAETLVLALKDSSTTRGVWEGSITLEDKPSSTDGNGILETYFRGELRGAVTPHDNAGLAAGADAKDSLLIAYPNQPAEIVITDNDGGKSVGRKTDQVSIVIRDQLFSKSGSPTITARVSCEGSGDQVSDVVLVWDNGAYVIKTPLDKGESDGTVDKNDASLHCRDEDKIVVTYRDPVYLDQRIAEAGWSDESIPRMYYANSRDSSLVTSVSDAADDDFLIVLVGKSPSRDKVDTIEVVLTTVQDEKLTAKAVETGAFTGIFIVKVDFLFSSAAPDVSNNRIDAKIIVENRINQVEVTGKASIAGKPLEGRLSLVSRYDKVARAYMKDMDGDGRADRAYFVFDHKVADLPSGLDEVHWNQPGGAFMRKAPASALSFLAGTDSTVLMADFSANQFGEFLTSIPEGKNPYAVFQDDPLFGGQQAVLADSVGPVAVTAVKHPSNLQSYTVTATEKRFNPDTLEITVSEKLRTTSSSFASLLRFSKGCSEYGESNPVQLFSPPSVSADGLSWLVIVDNTPDAQSPLVGDCIFLEADGRYVDMSGNLPGKRGAPITGENPKLVIRAFRGFPPVAGMDANTPGFMVTTNDPRSAQGGIFSQPTGKNNEWEVVWIPPFGFKADDPVGSVERIAKDFDNPQSGDRRAEIVGPQPMPPNISAVQVIASGSYKAQIRIFDNLGHFVRFMEQSFGTNGEDKNPWRATEKGQVSFLVWDMKDKDKAPVGQGVYVWKVNFVFVDKAKKSEVMFTRTGVLRR